MRINEQSRVESIPENLVQEIDIIYRSHGLMVSDLVHDLESKNYGACSFTLNFKRVVFRVARITPKKIGQFVTLWKREKSGPIRPYDHTDSADLFIISVRKKGCGGQFVFSKDLLVEKKVVSKDGVEGKRAIRVYPPWDNPTSQQGRTTQSWQLEYFLDFSANKELNSERVKRLYESAL